MANRPGRTQTNARRCAEPENPVLFELLIFISCRVAELGFDVQLGRFVVGAMGRNFVQRLGESFDVKSAKDPLFERVHSSFREG